MLKNFMVWTFNLFMGTVSRTFVTNILENIEILRKHHKRYLLLWQAFAEVFFLQ